MVQCHVQTVTEGVQATCCVRRRLAEDVDRAVCGLDLICQHGLQVDWMQKETRSGEKLWGGIWPMNLADDVWTEICKRGRIGEPCIALQSDTRLMVIQ